MRLTSIIVCHVAVGGLPGGWPSGDGAGGSHEGVDPTEAFGEPVDDCGQRGGVADVDRMTFRGRTALGDGGVELGPGRRAVGPGKVGGAGLVGRCRKVEEGDTPAGGDESQADGRSHPSGAPGDHGHRWGCGGAHERPVPGAVDGGVSVVSGMVRRSYDGRGFPIAAAVSCRAEDRVGVR